MNFFYLSVGLAFIFQVCKVRGDSCETVNSTYQRISHGEEAEEGEWPFVAALYNVRTSKFYCGGTLISNRHVLTAASCIQRIGSSAKLWPRNIEVVLGMHNLNERNEKYSATFKVVNIHIHPDWNVNIIKYDADLAILVLKEIVSFTNHIRPVSLPADDDIFYNVSGSTVGWPLTKNGILEDVPKETKNVVLDPFDCFRTHRTLSVILSKRMLCGSHVIINLGEAGNGFFVPSGSNWVQYGVSAQLITLLSGGNSEAIPIYTNVKNFTNWIFEKISEPIIATEEWPFVTAIYNVHSSRLLCSGTLISNRHVLTAANCIQGKGSQRKLEPANIKVLLGMHNLKEKNEKYSATLELVDIHIHPDWDVYSDRYDADLAILVLKENVSFTNYIQPIRLPTYDAIRIGTSGSTVGWVLQEKNTAPYEEIQNEIKIEVLNPLDCFTTHPELGKISSKHMVCMVAQNGTIERGFAGAGFYVHSDEGWEQCGIVAALPMNRDGQILTTNLFTNVKSFTEWIVSTIRTAPSD